MPGCSKNRAISLVYPFCLYLLLTLFPHIAGAALTKPVALEARGKDLVPDCLVYSSLKGPQYVLLVEKSTQKAYLYRNRNIDHPVGVYSCSTGENKGPKSDKDDKRTPEGVYFVTNSFRQKDLAPIYGAAAFPIDYPSPRDRELGRKGYGIWIHGTNETLKPRDTSGCVVFRNEDIIELSAYLGERHTPIIITERINFVEKRELQKEGAELKGFITGWLEAWRGGNIDLYMSCYAKEFRAGGKNWRQWRAHKRRLSRKYGRIDITIDSLKIQRENGIAVAKFNQVYKANGFFSVGEKRLYLQKKSPEWRIVDEFFQKKTGSAQRVTSRPRREEEFVAIKRLVSDWQKAWQEKDLKRYMANYSEDFSSLGLDREGWRRHKSEVNNRYSQIRVTIRNLKIRLLSSERATVYFDQEYRSDRYHDRGRKTIKLIKRDGRWRIRTEIWAPIGRRKGQ